MGKLLAQVPRIYLLQIVEMLSEEMGMRCQWSAAVKYLSNASRRGIGSWRPCIGMKMSMGSIAISRRVLG